MQTIYALLGHLFDPVPPRAFNYYIVIGALCVLLLAFSIFLRLYAKKNREDKTFRRLFRAYPGKLQAIVLVLASYLFFRYAGVPFLSLRILLYLTLAVMAYVLFRMGRTWFRDYPAQKRNRHEQMEKNKYLPRKKHH